MSSATEASRRRWNEALISDGWDGGMDDVPEE